MREKGGELGARARETKERGGGNVDDVDVFLTGGKKRGVFL